MKVVLQRLNGEPNTDPPEVALSAEEETRLVLDHPVIAHHAGHRWSVNAKQEMVFKHQPIQAMRLVYFGNLAVPRQTPQKLMGLVSGQLGDIVRSGFLKRPKNFLHLHLVLPTPQRVQWVQRHLLRPLGLAQHPRVQTRFSYRNTYEYPGIAWVYDLAKTAGPNDLIGYCHSKGASHKTPARAPRLGIEKALTAKVMCAWQRVKTVFDVMPALKLAAITTSNTSIGWFNFWWGRPVHLVKQGQPVRDPVRKWFWEVWLTKNPAPVHEQLNLQAHPHQGMFSIGSSYSRGFTLDGSSPKKIIRF